MKESLKQVAPPIWYFATKQRKAAIRRNAIAVRRIAHRVLSAPRAPTFEQQVAETKARALARPPRRLPPGPARDAVMALARAIGRAAAQDRFGPKPPLNPPPHRTTRGQR